MPTTRRFTGLFRLADAAAELDRITAEGRATADAYRASRDLTAEGKGVRSPPTTAAPAGPETWRRSPPAPPQPSTI